MLPINGRVAIVDDQYEQVRFLADDLSKHQIAYRVYDGTLDGLPEAPQEGLDFRVLFLDLNLLGNEEIDDKTMKSSLYGVLNRLIPANNYPFVLVYWSRHEEKMNLIENDLFSKTDLAQRKPIAFISAEKKDYFNLDGTPKEETVSKVFETISEKLKEFPAYHLLMEWENLIHKSADKTIQDIFKFDDWSNKSSELLSSFLISNMGFKHAKSCDNNQIKIRASLDVLNSLFRDSMGHSFANNNFMDVDIFNSEAASEMSTLINSRLLLDASDLNPAHIAPGCVFSYIDQIDLGPFFNDVCKVRDIEDSVKKEHAGWDKLNSKEKGKLISSKREDFRKNASRIAISVDPLCDFIQSKVKYNKFLEGMIFKAENKHFIDDHSEGVFISPSFEYDSKDYVLVLSLKHLNTKQINFDELPFKPLFRIRQEMLAEIQSKLARFISRQGILFLENNS